MRLRNNKGATLVELLVAMAVLAILMGQLGTLVYNSVMLYKKGSYEVDLQNEAQQFVNQLQEIMIDCDGSISFSAATSISDDSCIVVSNNSSRYTAQLVRNSLTDITGGQVLLSKEGDNPYSNVVMSEYVESLSIDMAAYESTSKITICVTMRNNEYSYRSCTDLYLRNDIGLSVNAAINTDSTSYDYDLDVLRYGEYDLDKLFGETGHTYKYTWADAAGPTFYDGIVAAGTGKTVKCGSTLNADFGYGPSGSILSAGRFIINRVDDATGETKTIAVSTRKVSVGAAGKPGQTKGGGLFYQSAGTTADYDGFIPVFGVDLSKADKVIVDFGFNFKNGTDYYYNGSWRDKGNSLDIDSKTETNLGNTINLNSFTDSNLKMKNSSGGEISLGDIQNIGNGLKVYIDKESNCCVYSCNGQITSAAGYFKMVENGAVCMVTSRYVFGSQSIEVYGFLYPIVPGSGGGGGSNPYSGMNCNICNQNNCFDETGHCKTNWGTPCAGRAETNGFLPQNCPSCGQWGKIMFSGSELKCTNCGATYDPAGGGGGSSSMTDDQKKKFYEIVDNYL